MHAGNDLLMPGGGLKVDELIRCTTELSSDDTLAICLGDLQKSAINNLRVIMNSYAYAEYISHQ